MTASCGLCERPLPDGGYLCQLCDVLAEALRPLIRREIAFEVARELGRQVPELPQLRRERDGLEKELVTARSALERARQIADQLAITSPWGRSTAQRLRAAVAAPDDQGKQRGNQARGLKVSALDLVGVDLQITRGACTQCYMDRVRDRDIDVSPEHAHCRAALDGTDQSTTEA